MISRVLKDDIEFDLFHISFGDLDPILGSQLHQKSLTANHKNKDKKYKDISLFPANLAILPCPYHVCNHFSSTKGYHMTNKQSITSSISEFGGLWK